MKPTLEKRLLARAIEPGGKRVPYVGYAIIACLVSFWLGMMAAVLVLPH